MIYSESELKSQLEQVIEKFRGYIKSLRTGRANPDTFESIMVEYYGSHVELKSIANVIIENALSVVIQPYDKSASDGICDAINRSELGYSPVNEGERIRINIPALTEERRKEIVKQMNLDLENQFRKRVRQIRQEFNQRVDKIEGEAEDQIKFAKSAIQEEVDDAIAKLEAMADKKETEIMDIK